MIWIGPRQLGAVGDADNDTIRRERRVQCQHRIGHRRRQQLGLAGFQRIAQGLHADAGLEPGCVGQSGCEYAVDQHQLCRAIHCDGSQRSFCPCQRRRVRHACQRQYLAHQRAQIGVFIFLDPAVRQALPLEAGECLRTLLRDL